MDLSFPNPVRSIFGTPLRDDSVIVNIGPSHPATHGTVQIIAELDGERVLRSDVHCGYLHRGFEKECEDHTWHNLIPYVDRLNYVSALVNDFAYCDGVERLMGVEITPRCRYLRTLLSEYSRLVDHLTCVAAGLMEMGAMTAFLYLVMVRDFMYEHLAALTGARVTYTYGRIGGLARDLPAGWLVRLEEILVQYEEFVARVHSLVDRNRIFIDRLRDVGVISTADALSFGCTGPILRSTGVARDLRKDTPYLAYAELDFDVPVGIKGDNYDRYFVRMREMDESVYMMRQLVQMLPEGPDQRRRPALHLSREAARLQRDRIAHQPLQAGHGRPVGAARRGVLRPRGAQRRARLLHGQHRRRHALQGARSLAELRPHGRGEPHARRRPARRHRSDLRLDQHDRRGVRPVKHLLSEFETMRRRFPAGFESSLVLPCLRRIQEDRGFVADADIDELATYLGVPRVQIEEVLSFYTQFRRAPVGRWHLQACRNVSCSMRGAEAMLEHLGGRLGIAPGSTTATAASRSRPSNASAHAAPRPC
jgi:NADH-quinone oxidoreductase subunit D